MKKRLISLMVVTMMLATFLVGCGSNEAEKSASSGEGKKPEFVFKLAENHAEGYPTTMADMEFARLVDEATDGRIKIEVYPNEQLGAEKEVVEQVQFGAIDFARVSISPITEFEPSLSVLMLPYLYRDKEHMFDVLDGEIGKEILDKLEESSDLVGLCWFDAGARNFYNSKRDVKTPEDMKGLKIRVQETELMMDLVSALGASPVAMAFSEVYSALQTGVVDGAENNWASIESTKHYEVANYITVDEHTRVPEMIVTSNKVLEKLSEEDQEIIRESAKKAGEFEREEWMRQETAAEEALIEEGCKVSYIEDNKPWQEKVKHLYDKHGEGYEELIERIIDTK